MLQISWPRTTQTLALPLLTTCIWAVAAAGIVFWVLQWPRQETVAFSVPVSTSQSPQDVNGQVAKALGRLADPAAGPAVQTSSQYKLMGVIVSSSGQGSALIATDGQPPKAYRVGQTIQEGVTLLSLTARQARLTSSSGDVLLDLPAVDRVSP